MSTIESLDLASLSNNPQSIADALEDALETTNNNIGLLKQQAESDANDIQNTHLVNAQNDANSINSLLLGLTPEHYFTNSMLNGWTAWNIQGSTTSESGVRMFKYGKLYILQISAFNAVGTGDHTTTILNIDGDITKPDNPVMMGMTTFTNTPENDYIAQIKIQTDGDIDVFSHSSDNTFHHAVGVFCGLDVS